MKSAWIGGCVGGWTEGGMDDLPALCRGSKKELYLTGKPKWKLWMAVQSTGC